VEGAKYKFEAIFLDPEDRKTKEATENIIRL